LLKININIEGKWMALSVCRLKYHLQIKNIRKSIENKYREGTMKSIRNKEGEIDPELEYS